MKYLYLLCFLTFSSGLLAEAIVGKVAENFKLLGHDGKQHELRLEKGKVVVLEWYNHGCPFVKKHYSSDNMQKLQKEFKSKVVWWTISSSAPGKQGHLSDSAVAKQQYVKSKMHSAALLLDGDGKVGKMYGAVTTPHFIIVDPMGKIAYNGAIDSVASADSEDISSATPLAKNAIAAIVAGKKAPRAKNRPYGCSVKY